MSAWAPLLEALALPEIAAQLTAFEEDILRFAGARNLVSRRDPQAVLRAHLAEALHSIAAAPPTAGLHCADLGSGAGIPAIPWLLARGGALDLIERRVGRADFLERELRAMGLAARSDAIRVLALDARDLPDQPGFRSYDWVSAKAVAGLQELLELVRPLLGRAGTLCVFGRPTSIIPVSYDSTLWRHEERLLSPHPAGPAFGPSALQLFRLRV